MLREGMLESLVCLSVCHCVCVSWFCSDKSILAIQHFVSKLVMVVQHYGPECHAKRLVYLQGQGNSVGSHNQDTAVAIIFSEQVILLQPNLV